MKIGEVGQTVITRGLAAALENNKEPKSDRILARYSTAEGDIYIITEWDRSYTTFMFCDEY